MNQVVRPTFLKELKPKTFLVRMDSIYRDRVTEFMQLFCLIDIRQTTKCSLSKKSRSLALSTLLLPCALSLFNNSFQPQILAESSFF